MNSIIYVGMDVHTTNYTLCCFSPDKDRVFAVAQVEPDYLNILKYLKRVEKNIGKPCQFLCGYEAGCLGYSLYHQLTESNVECVILAPTTMMSSAKQIKTDRRDAEKIAKCLAFNTYKPVYIPTEEDNAVKEYIRMRDDAKSAAKRCGVFGFVRCKVRAGGSQGSDAVIVPYFICEAKQEGAVDASRQRNGHFSVSAEYGTECFEF